MELLYSRYQEVAVAIFFIPWILNLMLNFFYDSLDTLKKVKKPGNQEVTNLTLIIFVVVIIAALVFALMDGVFNELYGMLYDTLRWNGGSILPTDTAPLLDIQEIPVDADAPAPVVPVEPVPVVEAEVGTGV